MNLSSLFVLIFTGFAFYVLYLLKKNREIRKNQEKFLREKGIINQFEKGVPVDRRAQRQMIEEDRRAQEDRRRDQKKKENFSPHQKMINKKAEEMLRSGNALAASQLLESIGLFRDAIDVLINAGRIYDGAKIFMRIGNHDRAGMLFSKYKKWEEAAECFYTAGLFELCGDNLIQGGFFEKAADLFLEHEFFEKAGDAYLSIQQYEKASLAYIKSKNFEKSIICIKKILSQPNYRFSFSKSQVDLIHDAVKNGDQDPTFISLLSSHGRLTELILYFLDQKDIDKAIKLRENDLPEGALALLAQVNGRADQGQALAQMFERCQDFKNAGIIYSRLNQEERAALFFEQAKEWERAIESYRKIGKEDKVLELQKYLTPKSNIREYVTEKKPQFYIEKPQESPLFSLGEVMEQTVIFASNNTEMSLPDQNLRDFIQSLKNYHYFQGLDDHTVEFFLSSGVISDYEKSTTILNDDRPHLGFYLLLKGAVLSSGSPNPILAPWVLNAQNVFFNKPSQLIFQAIEPSIVFYLTQNEFDDLMQGDGKLCLHFLRKTNLTQV